MSDLYLKKCPVCRARFKGSEPLEQACHRCDTDLQYVRSAFLLAQIWQEKARQALRNQQPTQAITAAQKAVQYVNTPSTRQTLAAALINDNQEETATQVLSTH